MLRTYGKEVFISYADLTGKDKHSKIKNCSHKRISLSGQGGEMNQALYAHMNNKRKMKKKKKEYPFLAQICMLALASRGSI
jgi:hypothetical protein